MGKVKRWGESFARWYLALENGKKKYAVSLCLASVTILGPLLIAYQVVPLWKSENTQVEVMCGDRQVYFSVPTDDVPHLNEKPKELESLVVKACTTSPSDS